MAGESDYERREALATATAETLPAVRCERDRAQTGLAATPNPGPTRKTAARLISGPTASTLRANPYPEVTDPICRFPLPTFFYRLEAVHLGDLMRISVRTGANVQNVTLPPDFQGPVENDHGRRGNAPLFGIAFLQRVHPKPSRSATEFQGLGPSSRKENSSRGSRQLLRFVSRYRDRTKRVFQIGRSRSLVPELGPDSLSP